MHHELQAAELFAWASLAFPRTPLAFRAGLRRLCREGLAHMALYLAHMRGLGTEFGAHPVPRWFWQSVPRFAAEFRAAGDDAGARILEAVEQDEIAHVAFAARWFERFTGSALDYDAWRAALPAPAPFHLRWSATPRLTQAKTR